MTTHGSSPTALAALNAPASTVLLAEVQGCRADITNPLEVDSPEANGMDNPYTNNPPSPNAKNAFGDLPGQATNVSIAQKTVHSAGANWLATDGHVKFLMPSAVSGGYNPAASPDAAQVDGGYANTTPLPAPAGTASMTDTRGSKFVMTFSEL